MKILKYLRVALLFILDASRPKFDVSGVHGNALIKLSSIGITNLSGKAGGSVFAHNRGGSYVRNFAVPSNPQTQAQALARALFGAFASAWRGLTQEVREAWKAAAVSFPYIDRFGDEKVMSGENLYISLNRNLQVVGESELAEPPIPQGVDGLIGGSLVASNNAGVVSLLFIGDLAGNDEATTKYMLYATPPLSPGISYAKNRLRAMKFADETVVADGTFTFETVYQTAFGAPPVGSKIIVRVDPINSTTGERGASFFTSAIVSGT